MQSSLLICDILWQLVVETSRCRLTDAQYLPDLRLSRLNTMPKDARKLLFVTEAPSAMLCAEKMCCPSITSVFCNLLPDKLRRMVERKANR